MLINQFNELQTLVCDAQTSCTELCRKALILSTSLKDEKFKVWITKELYGYKTIDDLPEYRMTIGNLKGNTGFKWVPVNISNPEDEIIKVVYFTQAVSELEALIKSNHSNKQLVFQLNDNLVRQLSKSTGYDCNFQVHFNQSECDRILQTVKTKILEWVLEKQNILSNQNANVSPKIHLDSTLNSMVNQGMQEKKYQIFISSTYTDLVDERQKVIDAILMSENIPIGMEMFKGQNKSQWEIIKRTIDSSDYYVLIIAHKYGSMNLSSPHY